MSEADSSQPINEETISGADDSNGTGQSSYSGLPLEIFSSHVVALE